MAPIAYCVRVNPATDPFGVHLLAALAEDLVARRPDYHVVFDDVLHPISLLQPLL